MPESRSRLSWLSASRSHGGILVVSRVTQGTRLAWLTHRSLTSAHAAHSSLRSVTHGDDAGDATARLTQAAVLAVATQPRVHRLAGNPSHECASSDIHDLVVFDHCGSLITFCEKFPYSGSRGPPAAESGVVPSHHAPGHAGPRHDTARGPPGRARSRLGPAADQDDWCLVPPKGAAVYLAADLVQRFVVDDRSALASPIGRHVNGLEAPVGGVANVCYPSQRSLSVLVRLVWNRSANCSS